MELIKLLETLKHGIVEMIVNGHIHAYIRPPVKTVG